MRSVLRLLVFALCAGALAGDDALALSCPQAEGVAPLLDTRGQPTGRCAVFLQGDTVLIVDCDSDVYFEEEVFRR